MKIKTTCLNYYLLFLCICLFPPHLFSQNTFVRSIGSPGNDLGFSCGHTIDNGIIMALESSAPNIYLNSALVKTDSLGANQWSKAFQFGEWSLPKTAMQANDEGYIVFGTATDTFNLSGYEKYYLYLHKTNTFGVTQWDKEYTMSTSDHAIQLIKSKSGGYIACSNADYNYPGSYPNAVITRLDNYGTVTWSKRFSCSYGLVAQKSAELANGNICFISYSISFSSFFRDILVTMLDANGNLLWTKDFSTYYDDEPNAITTNSSNELFITGRSYFMNREWDSFLLKLDSSGNTLFTKFYDAGTFDGETMRCIVERNDSCFLLGDLGSSMGGKDISMIGVDVAGSLIWAKKYPFNPSDFNYPFEMFQTADNGFVFTGDYRPASGALRNAILVRTDRNGDINCFNSFANYTVYNDTFHVTNVTLNSINSVCTVRQDSSTMPAILYPGGVICSGTTSVDQINNEPIRVYPNPVLDEFYIESQTNTIGKINILSIDGKIISALDIKNNNAIIDVSLYSTGLYILEYFVDEKPTKIRLIKY